LSQPAPETKAQRAERLKREQNPWDGLEQIRRFAREGFDAIPPQWKNSYFRWWGVYTQGDGAGVTGGKGGEGVALPYFMLRIRIPSGMLFSHQLRVIARLSREHGRGSADITVRQNIQLHWITIESLPEALEALWRCGLNSMGACGDVTRNITGCPLSGVDAEEVCDASPLVFRAAAMLVGNPAFYNLPRKYKICITGCRHWCSYPEINDVGLTALTRERFGGTELGFSLRVAGGLSTDPYLAPRLNAFVTWDQALPVIRGVTEIFRSADELREHRERARLKFLFLRHGWTPERFQEELEQRIGFRLDAAEAETPPDDLYRDHVGVHAQKQPGLFFVGASVLRGRISPEQMEAAADLADQYGSGEIRTTAMQNLVIPNVREANVSAVVAGLTAAGLPVEASPFHRGVIACTGSEFCKLAIAETKAFSRWLSEEMEERLPGFDQPLKIHVTGCPNSCGQHWIADVGLEAMKVKVDGKLVDAYYFFVGGAVGRQQAVARRTGYRCAAADAPAALERLLSRYLAVRQPGENLRQFFARHEPAELRTFLAGAPVAAEARNPSSGPPPAGVGG